LKRRKQRERGSESELVRGRPNGQVKIPCFSHLGKHAIPSCARGFHALQCELLEHVPSHVKQTRYVVAWCIAKALAQAK
jgi:hypothetical protein